MPTPLRRHFLTPFLLFSLVLSACSALSPITPGPSPLTQTVEPGSPTPETSLTPGDPAPADGPCAYMWASHELPELSRKVAASLQALDPALTGSAIAYGEDCVSASGSSSFSAMETDFRVSVSVTDLHDEETLGGWVLRVMEVITQLPASELAGPQPGRVDFEFTKSPSETFFLHVSIAKYKSLAPGLSGAEIFKLFNNNP